MKALGIEQTIDYVMSRYFQNISPWMPVISNIKLNRLIGTLRDEPRADLVILLLSMKLMLGLPTETQPAQSALYNLVKYFRFTLELAGLLTILMIQAGLLISVY